MVIIPVNAIFVIFKLKALIHNKNVSFGGAMACTDITVTALFCALHAWWKAARKPRAMHQKGRRMHHGGVFHGGSLSKKANVRLRCP